MERWKHQLFYKGVSKSFRTGHLEWELQTVQLSATRCNCITILWVLPPYPLCCFSSVHFYCFSVQKLLDTTLYIRTQKLNLKARQNIFPVHLSLLHSCIPRDVHTSITLWWTYKPHSSLYSLPNSPHTSSLLIQIYTPSSVYFWE
jgi:hypothetical protein